MGFSDAGVANDVVILVHGTSFTSEDNDGQSVDAWWHANGAREWLYRHLPPGTPVSFLSFSWSGRNSQVSRLEAGNELLALLLMLERKGRRYHLVGHSHGGSVIREALISSDITFRRRRVYAELRRSLNKPRILRGARPIIPARWDEYAPGWVKHKSRHIPKDAEYEAVAPFIELRGLRSWTTVGTPFLHYFPARRLFVNGWPGRRFSLHRPGGNPSLRALLLELFLTLMFVSPFFLLFATLMSGTGEWLETNSVAQALAVPWAVLWCVTFYAMSRQNYAETLLARERAAQHVSRRFGDRWLGLWASSDEAITSLAALAPKGVDYEWVCAPDGARGPQPALRDSGRLPLRRLALPDPVVGTHLLPDLVRFAPARLTKPFIRALNRWVEPLWRQKIATALTRTCQGSDLPAASLAFVSPWPLPLAAATTHPGLPADVDADLERAVSERTGRLRPALRQLLMAAALEGVPAAVEAVRDDHGTLAAGALVHTSYFEDPAVGRLIALHISSTATGAAARHEEAADDPHLDWLRAHREAIRAQLQRFLTGAVEQPAI